MSAKKKKVVSECTICGCFLLTKDSEKHKPHCGKENEESPIQLISTGIILVGITAVTEKRETFLPPDYFGWEKYESILMHPESLSNLGILPRSSVCYKIGNEEKVAVVWPCDELPQMKVSLINVPAEKRITVIPVKSPSTCNEIVLNPVNVDEKILKLPSFTSYLQMYLSNAFLIEGGKISVKYFGQTLMFKVPSSLTSELSTLSVKETFESNGNVIKLTSNPRISFDIKDEIDLC